MKERPKTPGRRINYLFSLLYLLSNDIIFVSIIFSEGAQKRMQHLESSFNVTIKTSKRLGLWWSKCSQQLNARMS